MIDADLHIELSIKQFFLMYLISDLLERIAKDSERCNSKLLIC